MTFTSCRNRKSKFNILKNHISSTARGKFTMFAPLYRSLFCKKYLQKGDPTLTFVQTGSQCWIFFLKVISQQPQELNLQFLHHCTDRQLSQNNFKKVTQIDLYFLSKPEVEKKKYSRGNVLRNFNMVCILSDVNKIDPNLTFRSSRTPSVCQYKHQSLVLYLFFLNIVFPTGKYIHVCTWYRYTKYGG